MAPARPLRVALFISANSYGGINCVGDSPWELKRTRIGWEDRLWRFRLKMAGAYDWIDR
ncbi:MAG: hypothetical protein HYY58_01490 [Candidatus Omnitrophica bacterium]|nr:hypothetical protein [Candidatus Omnitrophota bacterium]